ncbi:HesA/MoeB/ThiF family protein [Variovorax sp. 160MFSha2.1]|uniref:HesA/MoeB/ThiF family protein n=1 Tax=Variovorax sp. 160MFSha2.1 TaxID=3158367 RepID=UPI003AAFA549
MKQVAFPWEALAQLHAAAQTQVVETCAVGFVHTAGGSVDRPRYTVQGLLLAPENAYLERRAGRASLTPEFMLETANRARTIGAGVILLHTHPGARPLEGFSQVDDAGEAALVSYFKARIPDREHFAAVVTGTRVHLRELGGGIAASALAVGPAVRVYSGAEGFEADDRYDRQIRAFGAEGQAALSQLTVAVIGLGGTGSIVVQQLAHLGVGRFVLMDHDVVDVTNLNRLLGATPKDIGLPKVHVAERAITTINPSAICEPHVGDITCSALAARLAEVDFIFGCTDSMASRAVLNQLAYQYLIPVIDMGVAIRVEADRLASVTGRAQMLAPGLGCLVCADGIDGQQVRWEMMTPAQRRADPYFENASVPQPAVMPLNGMVTSAAVAMFLSALTSYPGKARLLHYDGMRGSIRPQLLSPRPHCIVCSAEGALARGDSWTLPVRT